MHVSSIKPMIVDHTKGYIYIYIPGRIAHHRTRKFSANLIAGENGI